MQSAEKSGVKAAKIVNPVRMSLGITSVAVALLALYPFAMWSMFGPLEHALQHLMIFGGGVGLGAAIFIPEKKED